MPLRKRKNETKIFVPDRLGGEEKRK